MSMVEIKLEIDAMSAGERRELAEYLRARWRRDDPEWQEELARRCSRVMAGEGYGAEDLQRVHSALIAEGK